MSLSTIWTQGVPADRKDEVVKTIKNSQIVLERLDKIIKDYLEQLEVEEEEIENFLAPEWQIRQAMRIGRRKELKRLQTIIGSAR